jgi:hypothetical protein
MGNFPVIPAEYTEFTRGLKINVDRKNRQIENCPVE